MKYKVVVTNYFVNGVKYRRGDIVDIPDGSRERHGTKLEQYTPPIAQKRKRRTKAEMEAARNEEV